MKLKKESMSTGNKLHLPDITIFTFCWGTEHVQKSIRAMLIAMDQINFKKCIKKNNLNKFNLVMGNVKFVLKMTSTY